MTVPLPQLTEARALAIYAEIEKNKAEALRSQPCPPGMTPTQHRHVLLMNLGIVMGYNAGQDDMWNRTLVNESALDLLTTLVNVAIDNNAMMPEFAQMFKTTLELIGVKRGEAPKPEPETKTT